MEKLGLQAATVALAVVVGASGCGSASDAPAAGDRPTGTASEPSRSPEPGPTGSSQGHRHRDTHRQSPTGPGDALGIDEADWPTTLAGAEALLDRMQPTLDGKHVRRPRIFSGAAGVVYGRGGQAPTAWVMEADSEVPDAPAALAVMFGLTMTCAEDSYAGTIPQSRYGGVPEMDLSGAYRSGEPWWFSCTVDGAEGDPGFTAHALGWASGDLGWLTTTPDRATTRALVDALLAAR